MEIFFKRHFSKMLFRAERLVGRLVRDAARNSESLLRRPGKVATATNCNFRVFYITTSPGAVEFHGNQILLLNLLNIPSLLSVIYDLPWLLIRS